MATPEHRPVNLGNPIEMKIIQFAEAVQRLTGAGSQLVHVTPTDERTKDDPQVRRPDISRAREVLGWEPRVSLDEGLAATIAYFRGLLGSAEKEGR
jgi:nucleoside-diphosphate-sugar epimerase